MIDDNERPGKTCWLQRQKNRGHCGRRGRWRCRNIVSRNYAQQVCRWRVFFFSFLFISGSPSLTIYFHRPFSRSSNTLLWLARIHLYCNQNGWSSMVIVFSYVWSEKKIGVTTVTKTCSTIHFKYFCTCYRIFFLHILILEFLTFFKAQML